MNATFWIPASLATVGAAASLWSVLSRVYYLVQGERKLRTKLHEADRENLHAQFNTLTSLTYEDGLGAQLRNLRSKLDEIVQRVGLQEKQRDALLWALRQPSEIGKEQYARKLYAILSR